MSNRHVDRLTDNTFSCASKNTTDLAYVNIVRRQGALSNDRACVLYVYLNYIVASFNSEFANTNDVVYAIRTT